MWQGKKLKGQKQSGQKVECKGACELPRRGNWLVRPSSKGRAGNKLLDINSQQLFCV